MTDEKPIVLRNAAGHYLPGQSGNRGGLPKVPPEVKEALRAATLPAAQRLAQLVQSDDEKIALLAIKEVLDRTIGKPREETREANDPQQATRLDASKLSQDEFRTLRGLVFKAAQVDE